MSFGDDIKVIGAEVGYTLFGDLKAEYYTAIQMTMMQGNIQPLIAFYNANEGELNVKYGLSLNQLIGMSPNQIAILAAYGEEPQTGGKKKNPNKGMGQGFIYAIAALILGGAGVILIIKATGK